ncbi:hypothetical protein [Shewanella algae]
MDKGQCYLRWLAYVAVIAVFSALFLATLGKAAMLVYENLK